MSEIDGLKKMAASLVGESLTSILGQFHSLNGILSSEAIALFLNFSNNVSLKISCSSDGESIDVEECFPYEYSMQSEGEVVLVDKSEYLRDENFVNSLFVVFDIIFKKYWIIFFAFWKKCLY